MGEELDQQVTETPEQQEIFGQTLMPEVQPATQEPEQKTEPEKPAEPEAPIVEPSWLSEPAPRQEHQQPTQPQYDYSPQYGYQQPQQPAQAPPYVGGDLTEKQLNEFVKDPDRFVNQAIDARMQQYTAPLQQSTQTIAYMMNTMLESNVNQSTSAADNAIRKAYDVFNKDSSFRSNKAMQEKVAETFKGMRERAIHEARTTGNFGPLNALSSLNEADIRGTLAYLKAVSGTQSPGIGPLQVEGATVESSRSSVADQGIELTPDQEEAAKRLGPGGREKILKSILETQKYDDFEAK